MNNLPDNLTPVRPAHVFDEVKLAAFMKDRVEGYKDPLQVLQFEGGQSNPTFLLTDGGGRRYVMRKKRPGRSARIRLSSGSISTSWSFCQAGFSPIR
jgi:aminoglycoside phosphotransferase (APT) family kinase protein